MKCCKSVLGCSSPCCPAGTSCPGFLVLSLRFVSRSPRITCFMVWHARLSKPCQAWPTWPTIRSQFRILLPKSRPTCPTSRFCVCSFIQRLAAEPEFAGTFRQMARRISPMGSSLLNSPFFFFRFLHHHNSSGARLSVGPAASSHRSLTGPGQAPLLLRPPGRRDWASQRAETSRGKRHPRRISPQSQGARRTAGR